MLFKLKEKLMNMVRWLITEKSVDKFLFGSKSNFDDFCQEVVKELREEYPPLSVFTFGCIIPSHLCCTKRLQQTKSTRYRRILCFFITISCDLRTLRDI